MAARNPIRAAQLVLPIEEIERTFDLGEFHQAFVSAYVQNGGNGAEAWNEARKAVGKVPSRNAKTLASRLLGRGKKSNEEVKRAIELRRLHAARAAMVTEEEVLRSLRVVRDQAMGLSPVRKTMATRNKDGALHMSELEVYDPNLPAAKGAIELLGKSIAMFTDKQDITASMSLREIIGAIDDDTGPGPARSRRGGEIVA